MTPERWGKTFILKLMLETHKQWLFRNAHIHYKNLDGVTTKEHDAIFTRVNELLLIDPADLLPRHIYLLSGDFADLGEGSTVHRQHWVASMESALTSANYVTTDGAIRVDTDTLDHTPWRICDVPVTRNNTIVTPAST